MNAQNAESSFTVHSTARTKRLPGVSATEARDRLRRVLGPEGFAVVAEVDLADFVNRRLDEDAAPYYLLEACHPLAVRRALAVAREGGLLEPTRFAVWAEGHEAVVAVLPWARLAEALAIQHLAPIGDDVEERIDRIFARLEDATLSVVPAERPQSTELDKLERAELLSAVQSHIDDMMREAARTDSHPLQHSLAQSIDRLESVVRKLGGVVR